MDKMWQSDTNPLQASYRYQAAILGSMLDAVIVVNPDGTIRTLNHAALELLGYLEEDLLGQPVGTIFEEEEEEEEEEEDFFRGTGLAQLVREGAARDVEMTLRTKSGERIPVVFNGSVIRGGEGRLSAVVGVARDMRERKRAEEKIQQRTAQLEALREVGLELTSQLDLDTLLRSIVSRAIEMVSGTYGGLYLYRPEEDVLEWAMTVGPELAPIGTILRRGEGLAGKVWDTGEPLIVDDYRALEGRAAVWEGYPVMAVVSVPVRWGEKFLGVLNVHTDTPRTFSPADAELLSLFATQAAIAIENARLYEETHRQAQEATALYDVVLATTSTLSMDQVLNVIYEHVDSLLHVSAFYIALYNEERQELHFELDIDQGERRAKHSRKLSEERGFTDWIVRSKEPLCIDDIQTEENRLPVPGVVMGNPTRSWLGFPLMVKDRVIGVISAQSYEPHAFDERHRRLLSAIANQVAIAIENARLFAEIREHAELMDRLQPLSQALNTTRTPTEAVETICRGVMTLAGADRGAIYLRQPDDTVTCPWAVDISKDYIALVTSQAPEMPGGRLLERTDPVLIPDLQALPKDAPLRRLSEAEGYQAVGLWPLVYEGRVVAAVGCYHDRPHRYTAAEAEVLLAFGRQAAVALQNARLYQETQLRLGELSTLYEAGKAVIATLRIGDVLDFIVSAASEALRAEGSYLFLWDEQEERLIMRAVQGFASELVGQVKYRLGEGICGWVFLEGKTVNVPDVAKDPRWKPEPEYEASLSVGRIISALVVPLVVGTKTLGVLGVVNKTVDDGRLEVAPFTSAGESLLATLAGQVAVAIENARLYEDVRGLSLGAIRSMAAAIDARDPYTKGHSDQVARLSVLLARKMGWEGADLEMLEFAALMHDVGKIGIPDAVLRKVEPLTSEDWNIIHYHPYHSAQIVKPVEPLHRIIPWIYHHQERWDGTGYPDGLKGEDIPLAARIIAVADAYNAMTTDRPYRKAKNREEAIAELQRYAGTQLDPQVVEVFVQLLEVELDIT